MLTNFVAQADLVKHYPKLASYLPSTQSDWVTQITEAFNILLDDIRSRRWEPRTMMIPLDLKRAATATGYQHILTSSAETETKTSTHIDGVSGFNRFVVVVTAITGTSGYSIQLQGSNDQAIDDATEPSNWTNVGSAIAPTATGTSSGVIQTEYKYYRYIHTVTGSPKSLTYTAALYETFADRWIIHKALELIFRDMSKQVGDIFDERCKVHASLYAQALQSYKFTIDGNDDNLIDNLDTFESAQTILTR